MALAPSLAKTKSQSAVKSDLPKFAAAYKIESLAPNLHTYQISVTVQNAEKKDEIDFVLPAWRPGRYQIQNYAANVQEFKAVAGNASLYAMKTDKQTWHVKTDAKPEITVTYKYYAGAQLDAGNSYVGADEMYFNGSNVFVYTDETRFKPASLDIVCPDNWKIATQLTRVGKSKTFAAETYDDLIDSPTIASPTLIEFSTVVRGATIRMAFQNGERALKGFRFNEKNITRDIAQIVETQFDLFQEVPFKDYVFLYHITPYRYSHGVEHKNSTSIVVGAESDMDARYDGFLSVTSHEFYHVWNIKRIIPKEFAPYNYTREAYTPMLYVCEGFTSYYGDLSLTRSKVWNAARYLGELGANMTDMQNTYGRKIQPLALSSFDAWLSGYGAGRANSTVSFYSKGELVGLLLDIEIRRRTENKASLDDVMLALNNEFAKKNKGFSASDFEGIVEKIGGGTFKSFFEKYVYGTDELPFASALETLGLDVKKSLAKTPYFGAATAVENNFPVVGSLVPESPAALAGFDKGDMLIALNGQSLMNEPLTKALERSKPDETVKISFLRNGKLMETSVKLSGVEAYTIVKKPTATDAQKKMCESWLKAKWDEI
jgi:predicted metalloprotease with PDZ domain